MIYYKVANLILESELELPTYHDFLTEEKNADVFLRESNEIVPSLDSTLLISAGDMYVYKYESEWHFCSKADSTKRLVVSNDYTHLRSIRLDIEQIEPFLRFALECKLISKGIITLHSACVKVNGSAIAFTGPSGIGKSTRANLCIEALGGKLISGDRPLIDINNNIVYGVPWDGKEQCFSNESIPLNVIFEVRRCKATRIRKLSAKQCTNVLYKQCFIPMWDSLLSAIQLTNIRKLAQRLNMYRLFCDNTIPSIKDAYSDFISHNIMPQSMKEYVLNQPFQTDKLKDGSFVWKFSCNKASLKTYRINETAKFTLEKLQNPICIEDLVFTICSMYNVDDSIVKNHLLEFTSVLVDSELVGYIAE